ncbi:threonine aldolase family protein [Paenimyroides aestuarii]|uniref:Aminotransferase class I/II-fold pyridoxal phosphate-dependent enzyme n=1 Tax=Paenimyroides aestuarii TaxID=2968490 RepID=A0ABY5NPW0_9FLAO|nr:aminotransferase class I/II-fold pyridoxal phosphate-dependent enzyme [Paenimyroides aestuarii]UUV20580.1 aminotransferase class I/II-fold pyridoxal phosphate-dependent enzyme [Paenimyroides aestuarii]
MYNFRNDYSEGAHPNILQKLITTNLQQQPGYGDDVYSEQAKILLKKHLENFNAAIHFVSGGTQTNLLVIAALLKVHEAVISAHTGHIFSHETGAIEAVGHRIITIETTNGKLQQQCIEAALKNYQLRPHIVKPKMVYISNATEVGSIYTKAELIALWEFCQTNNLLLFMDGARLGNALMTPKSDVTLADLSKYTDVFYIGGTKNGALLGEAIVFNNQSLAPEFDYVLKQKGALLAKGRLLGIQFLELFTNDLYFQLATHANQMAMKMATAISALGFGFLSEPVTNQIFPILPKKVIESLANKYLFYQWKEIDAETAIIRLITSWATDEQVVNEFIADLQQAVN